MIRDVLLRRIIVKLISACAYSCFSYRFLPNYDNEAKSAMFKCCLWSGRKIYLFAKPIGVAKARMEAEATVAAADAPLHADNEWNISVVDDDVLECTYGASSGLALELPSANEFVKSLTSGATDTAIDELEDLRRQPEALNAN
ncbi:hypothetical protein E1A91_A07G058700v1 [Gossypium mustelinum]|uniref:Uncharacterized protein n=1 Tax=Gossypium mustelinum TaxID=34275 RepID=A0A5D2YHC9_GOSMU|nr:hypothetical protein E1A91_A07G058700v1 [Gossypium mustelinum]